MGKLIINKGDRFGSLVVVKEIEPHRLPCGQINRMFQLKCDCGKLTNVRLLHFVRGRIKTCSNCKNTKGEVKTRLYRIWRAIRDRSKMKYQSISDCYKSDEIDFFDGWEDFLEFKNWSIKNGYKNNLQIDRIDGTKGYNPENCRWVTPIENCNNRYNTYYVKYKNKKYAFMDLIRLKGLENHQYSVRSRIKRGWSIENAIDKPF